MKKAISLLMALAVMLGLLVLPTFADGGTLSEAQNSELRKAADLVMDAKYDETAHWKGDVYGAIVEAHPEYSYYADDDIFHPFAAAPAAIYKNAFYSATGAPKEFFESYMVKKFFSKSQVINVKQSDNESIETQIVLGYDAENDIYCSDTYMDNPFPTYYFKESFNNNDGTYSFCYAGLKEGYFDPEPEELAEALAENGIVITLKFEDNGVALVSDKAVDKLPSAPASGTTESDSTTPDSNKPASENPNTSNDSNIALIAVLVCAFAAIFTLTVLQITKKSKAAK